MDRSSQYVQEEEAFGNTPSPPGWDLGTTLEEMMGDQTRKPPAQFPIVKPAFVDPPPMAMDELPDIDIFTNSIG